MPLSHPTTMSKAVTLLINDIHASRNNLSEFVLNWNEALEICREENIPEMVIGGDLWQARSSQQLSVLMTVREAVLRATEEYGLRLIIAEGNHCKVDQESTYGYSHIFQNYRNVRVVDDFIRVSHEGFDLWVMSYFPENGSFPDKLKAVEESMDKDRRNVLYIHQGIAGALPVPASEDLPAALFDRFDKVLVGHYHNRKRIKDTDIYYIGASRQHNFGEDSDKGYTILYSDGSHEFVRNSVNTTFETVSIDAGSLDTLRPVDGDGGKRQVRLIVECDREEPVNRQALMDMGYSKVEVRVSAAKEDDSAEAGFDSRFDKEGIISEYRKYCGSKGYDGVELGVSYLQKI